MRNNNLKAQFIYRLIWVVIAVIATICTFTDHLSVFGGDERPVMLFYTTWSVWLSTVVAIIVFVRTTIRLYKNKEKNGYNDIIPILKFCSNIMIISTFIVAGFVLPDKLWTANYWTFGGAFKHFLLPIVTVFDTVIFDPRNRYRVSYPFLGVVLPLLYWIILIIRICIKRKDSSIPQNLWDNYYPYGFTNFDDGHSLGGLCKLLAGILVGLILIGFIFYFVDKLHKEDGKIKFDSKLDIEAKDIFSKKEN